MNYYDILFAKKLAGEGGGSSVEVEPLSVTENGTYTADQGKAYSPVNVNVPQGVFPEGTTNITQNGTYDVSSYASAEVNVSGSESHEVEDALIDGSLSGAYVNSRITTVKASAFAGQNYITSISLPNATSIRTSAFNSLTRLESLSIPKFATTDSAVATSIIKDTKLEIIVVPSMQCYAGLGCFGNNSYLTTIDFGTRFERFDGNAFQTSPLLSTVILRGNYVVYLSGTANFNSTAFKSSGTGGTLYVPQAQISAYQSATNWSTILGYANNSIQAIEGSIYENAYADGTPIGA